MEHMAGTQGLSKCWIIFIIRCDDCFKLHYNFQIVHSANIFSSIPKLLRFLFMEIRVV